jgi:hypothetical protein
MWAQWDWGHGPTIAGRQTWLFCAWLAWCRFRVVFPVWDKTLPTVIVDHAAVLGPSVVDVAVQQPIALVDGSMFDVPVAVLAVAAVREVTHHDVRSADVDARRSLHDLVEAGIAVSLGPAVSSSAVSCPATVVVAGNEDLAAV